MYLTLKKDNKHLLYNISPNCLMVEEGFYTPNTAMLFGINTLNRWGSINN